MRYTDYEREVKRVAAEWKRRFAAHVATLSTYTRGDGEKVEELRWAKPGTGIEAITYHSVGPRLIVTGDLYDAIYVRAEGIRWWATCNWDYFASKCVASPEGRGFRSWTQEKATKGVKYQLRDAGFEKRKYFRDNYGWDALDSSYEWGQWLQEHGTEVFGCDYWELGDIGMDVDWVCKCHLYGLKMAIAQLDARSPEKVAV